MLNRLRVNRRTELPWTTAAVKDLLRRGRFYAGWVVMKRGVDERPGKHEPIITDAEYQATAVGVASRRRAGSKPGPYRTYLLRGVVRCACGAKLRGEARVQRGSERRCYRCPVAGRDVIRLDDHHRPVRCSARLVPADPAETIVLDAIRAAVLPSRAVEAAREELRARLALPRESLSQRQRARLQTRLERLREQHEWGDITDEVYWKKRTESRRELAGLPDRDKLTVFDRNRGVMASMAENIDAATPAQLTELIALLVESVIASDGRLDAVTIAWTPPARPFFRRWLEYPQGDSNP